jgi:predicted helicase
MSNFKLKSTHTPVKAYYETLERFERGKFDNEGNVRRAFEALLENCARKFDWMVVPEYQIQRTGKNPLRVDAAVLDAFNLPRGYWEAKDTKDNLQAEMNMKFADGYPRTNIIFQEPTHAILFQDGRIKFDDEIESPEKLVDVLRLFFEWKQPLYEGWAQAASEFSERIPEIATGALKLIADERKRNPAFVERFTAFATLCRKSINPKLKDEAVEEMLVQHLLTERIFRRIFDNPQFTRRNVIAAEIEKVIDSLTSRYFSRDSFLHDLDRYYKAIEETAATIEDYSGKQNFLNKVYEGFFHGINPKQADTYGIVYTPQSIVEFMVRSVEDVLKAEFGRSLSDKGVHILDPFVGTGNFITRVMKEIRTSSLPHKYKQELHCNEIMLLPYYIASMNIEHAYLDRVGEYEPFEGICLVDTFDMRAQATMFADRNLERIERQRKQPIFVVIGNPPYNAWQQSESDNNKNRRYIKDGGVDLRVSKTYSKASKATNKNALSDPYVKAIRWASDRIGKDGIVAFVSNSGFIDGIATDGMRKHLTADFDEIYILDLGGNVRKNPKLSGTTHNVFGIQVGVSINIFVRKKGPAEKRKCKLFYASTDEFWTRKRKELFLEQVKDRNGVDWVALVPDNNCNWLTKGLLSEFGELLPITDIFDKQSRGVATSRDLWVYNNGVERLTANISRSIDFYNGEIERFIRTGSPKNLDSFVNYDESRISWSRDLKQDMRRGRKGEFSASKIRTALYRPYVNSFLFFDRVFNEEVYVFPSIMPNQIAECENRLISLTGPGSDKPFLVLSAHTLVDLHLVGPGCSTQCFPFYTYDEDGTNRRENITDWALAEFRKHYGDMKISKWDIFHYTYGLLHHPEYRTKYAANLKRELPRIPMAAEFGRFAEIGAALMKLHIEYEKQKEYPLEKREAEGVKLNWRVERMTLSKDKTQLKYNEFLTLSGIPAEAYEYRLGNRSALEWVVDQYLVSTDTRSGIVNDPNREDDPEYIVRLVGQVVKVSVETVRLVKELARLSIEQV